MNPNGTIGNINTGASPGVTYNIYGAPQAGPATSAGGLGSLLGGVLQTGAGVYGAQNAAEANTNANLAAINTFTPQQQIGMGAMSTLGSTLGTSGAPANYNNFLNMPGYQFATQQGTQAIDRQAAAAGSLYTPNTQAAVGQYVTGTAMQDYNTYVNQLLQTSQFGQNANANIAQAQINTGEAQAAGYSGAANAVGGFLGGANGSGLIGAAANGIGNLFGGGSGSGSGNTSGYSTAYGTNLAGASDIGSSPVNTNLNTQYQNIEQGQEDALYNSSGDSGPGD